MLGKLLRPLGTQQRVRDFSLCSTVCLLFLQNNLNLLRDMAVLIARDFKSKPVPSQLFVLHRYRGVQGKGGNGIMVSYTCYGSCISLTPFQACFSRKNINKVNRGLNCLSCVIEGMC